MKNIVKALVIAPIAGFMLVGCSEATLFFTTIGNPQDVSSCEYVLDFLDGAEEEGFLCAECNSSGPAQASASACGVEISARCNSNLDDDIFGIALGRWEGSSGFIGITASEFTASAWVDSDGTPGPSDGDEIVCHTQSLDDFGKQEWKCTNALKGNGKTATTFEASIKYDASKNNCNGV